MPQIEWHQAIDQAQPLIFRILTPSGSGTGFLVSKSDRTNFVAVATALHVVEHAHAWGEPIKLQHHASGHIFHLNVGDRAIFIEQSQDTAAIVFELEDLEIAEPIPALLEAENTVKMGVEVGWLGFPAVSSGELCFFSGRVSSLVQGRTAYLVDGVAINGVSGGPTLWLGYEEIKFIGVVSAYIPNRSTGESLPGLAVVQDVMQFHDVVSRIRSIDEAKEQETEGIPDTSEDGSHVDESSGES